MISDSCFFPMIYLYLFDVYEPFLFVYVCAHVYSGAQKGHLIQGNELQVTVNHYVSTGSGSESSERAANSIFPVSYLAGLYSVMQKSVWLSHLLF